MQIYINEACQKTCSSLERHFAQSFQKLSVLSASGPHQMPRRDTKPTTSFITHCSDKTEELLTKTFGNVCPTPDENSCDTFYS